MKNGINLFKKICKDRNWSDALPRFPNLEKQEERAFQAHYMLVVIIRHLNAGWLPDWNNPNEYKYYNYFFIEKKTGSSGFGSSGFGFSVSYYSGTFTYTNVGSRLCFKTYELAQGAAKDKAILELYEEYLLIK